jgi:hypothetical protein
MNWRKNEKKGNQISKNWKWNDFWGFQILARSGGKQKEVKITGFYIWFSVSSQKYRRTLKIHALYLVCSQIWLNLPRDGRLPLWVHHKIWKKKFNTGCFCAKIGSGHLVLDPPFSADIPEEAAKNQSCQQCEDNSHKVIVWTAPICQMLLPQSALELLKGWLRILGWKWKVHRTWNWFTQFLH